MSGKRNVPSTEGSKQSKSKKSKVDPLQRSLLCFFQPLDDSRREDQQGELQNVDDGENIDDGFDMVQQDEEDNGTQQETADTPLTTVDCNRERNPARKRKRKRRRKRSSCLRVEASDDDDDDDDDGDRYDEEEHDSDGAVSSFSVPKDVFIATFLFGVGLKPISGTQLPAASKPRPSARIPKEHPQVVKELIASFAGVRLGRIWGMVKDSAASMGVPLG